MVHSSLNSRQELIEVNIVNNTVTERLTILEQILFSMFTISLFHAYKQKNGLSETKYFDCCSHRIFLTIFDLFFCIFLYRLCVCFFLFVWVFFSFIYIALYDQESREILWPMQFLKGLVQSLKNNFEAALLFLSSH